MKLLVLIALFVAFVAADCGCLRCCKDLQRVDIPGPCGCPVKVVFRKPQQCGCEPHSCHSATVQAPLVPPPLPQVHLPGRSYNYKVQYFCKPCCCKMDDCGGREYSAKVQAPLPPVPRLPLPLLGNLKYRTDTILVPTPKCEEPCINTSPGIDIAAELGKLLKNVEVAQRNIQAKIPTGPTFEQLSCCQCNRFETTPSLVHSDMKSQSRHKRDLADHSYKFLMNMLPKFVRDPLHHSIRGTRVEPTKLNWREKLVENAAGLKKNRYNTDSILGNSFLSKPSQFDKNSKNFWETIADNTYKQTPKRYLLPKKTERFENNLYAPSDEIDFLKYSLLKEEPKTSKALSPELRNYKFKFPFNPSSRAKDTDETTLLRKLKKLNNNPFSSNLEDQATDFMNDLLQPQSSLLHKRSRRSTDTNLKRDKRTIILSSDEIDLPVHYEVDIVSVEDEEPEDSPEFSSESEEDDDPVVGDSPFRGSRLFPRPPMFQPKPEIIISKNVIQKAVRDELSAYHSKVEREQKMKELKANLQRKHQEALVPQNPIFLLLTAPMKFLRHFHDLNKGVAPVMTSLPKLVYTTKKYFRDFGKNFHKNCLNLASDIIGDFDYVQPNIVEKVSNLDGGRYKRDVSEDEVEDAEASSKLTPDYTVVFRNSNEAPENFRQAPNDHVRKKRYVIKVVDDHEIQDQVEDYLTRKLDDNLSYLKPLRDYYEKFNSFLTNLQSNYQPLGERDGENFYYRPAPHHGVVDPNSEESLEVKPKKKKLQIRKVKPKIIIDNKGLPFMEVDGFKRPLLLNKKKFQLLKGSTPENDESSEETRDKITSLIARAKEDSEIVGGSVHRDIIPHQIVKERISSLLDEIDQLVHLNAEDYDTIYEDLIRIQHIKTSIEQDWKRLLIDDRVDDINVKIGLLSKFKDLQQAKDDSVNHIAEALQKNENEFVRRHLVHCLIRLQKLQCLITSVVNDFEQYLKLKTSFNTQKEIKYVDFLAELKFVNAKTRNDLIKKLCKDRDVEGQKNIELLHKLKKLLISSQADSEKFDQAAKLIWEMKNLKKLQSQTIEELNKKLSRNFKIKKELKILFDLQKRFEECGSELNELLSNVVAKGTPKLMEKKDVKKIIAEIKQKHEELLQKTKERANTLQKLKKS